VVEAAKQIERQRMDFSRGMASSAERAEPPAAQSIQKAFSDLPSCRVASAKKQDVVRLFDRGRFSFDKTYPMWVAIL
jgi:hypothetical protein